MIAHLSSHTCSRFGSIFSGACGGVLALLAGGCNIPYSSGGSGTGPPPQQYSTTKWADFKLWTVQDWSNGSLIDAVTDLEFNVELAEAGYLWLNGCKVGLNNAPYPPVSVATVIPLRISNAAVRGTVRDPWILHDAPLYAQGGSNVPLDYVWLTQQLGFPPDDELQIMAVYQVFQTPSGATNPFELGGVVMQDQTTGVPPFPYIYVSGLHLRTYRRIVAHELGHIFALADLSTPTTRLMFNLGQPGSSITNPECITARSSPYVK